MENNYFEEYLQSLRDCLKAARELRTQTLETNRAMDSLINKSHLRSALTLMKDDFLFKNLMDIAV